MTAGYFAGKIGRWRARREKPRDPENASKKSGAPARPDERPLERERETDAGAARPRKCPEIPAESRPNRSLIQARSWPDRSQIRAGSRPERSQIRARTKAKSGPDPGQTDAKSRPGRSQILAGSKPNPGQDEAKSRQNPGQFRRRLRPAAGHGAAGTGQPGGGRRGGVLIYINQRRTHARTHARAPCPVPSAKCPSARMRVRVSRHKYRTVDTSPRLAVRARERAPAGTRACT